MLEEGEYESTVTLTASTSIPQPPEDYTGSPPQISAAPTAEASAETDDYDDGEDFEFVVRNPETGAPITADEIFSNGRIRPIYPVFNRELVDGEKALRKPLRRLLIEEREAAAEAAASSSSTPDDLEGVPPGTYCVWKPRSETHSPERCRKSTSTGSSLRWRIRDLVVRRSQSDGKDRFVLFSPEEKAAEGEKKKAKVKQATEIDVATAHRRYHEVRSSEEAASKGGAGGRKSYLPYKPDIVGIFANVNGISRAHHPF